MTPSTLPSTVRDHSTQDKENIGGTNSTIVAPTDSTNSPSEVFQSNNLVNSRHGHGNNHDDDDDDDDDDDSDDCKNNKTKGQESQHVTPPSLAFTAVTNLEFTSLHLDNERSIYKTLSSLRKSTLSIPNRLRSILSDAEFVVSLASESGLPLIANERCGGWYIPPSHRYGWHQHQQQNGMGSAYFKSTDGHHGQWAFSLRRLNLQVLEVLGREGGAILVDSTRRGKILPDALRRTVPIWVSVWNRVLFSVTDPHEKPSDHSNSGSDSETTTTKKKRRRKKRSFRQGRFQSCALTGHETWQIEQRIDGWVEGLKSLGLNLDDIKKKLGNKPIRCLWVVNGDATYLPDGWTEEQDFCQSNANENENGNEDERENQWNTLILCSASKRVLGAEMSDDGYVQGAGDDSEGWSCGLTSKLFWDNKDKLLKTSEDELPGFIQGLVERDADEKKKSGGDGGGDGGGSAGLDAVLIGPTTNLFLGAGNIEDPQMVSARYDLVVNCNGQKFLAEEAEGRLLVLGCRRGKLGSKDLREKLAVVRDRALRVMEKDSASRILIIDESGRDLAVGAAVMLLCVLYNARGLCNLSKSIAPIDKQYIKTRLAWITTVKPDANPSRATLQAVNSFLIERPV